MTLFVSDPDFDLHVGDVREVIATLPAGSVDCCVTSPPYWGLRDYGAEGQIGLEQTPGEYVEQIVAVFREVRRVLADHGTVWLNLGDSYAAARSYQVTDNKHTDVGNTMASDGLKPKDLVGVPWRVAFALQDDGWYLRSDIVWSKPNVMPESVTDRPTKAHEYVFMLSKRPRYFFDQEAVREPHSPDDRTKTVHDHAVDQSHPNYANMGTAQERWPNGGRNIRSVWEITTAAYSEAHFATFPEALPERCIKAGCPEFVCGTCGKPRERIVERKPTGFDGSEYGERAVEATGGAISGGTAASTLGSGNGKLTADHETVGWTDCGHDNWRPGTVLDPFMGSGTTALVARKLGRRSVGVELNPEYAKLCAGRLQQLSLFA